MSSLSPSTMVFITSFTSWFVLYYCAYTIFRSLTSLNSIRLKQVSSKFVSAIHALFSFIYAIKFLLPIWKNHHFSLSYYPLDIDPYFICSMTYFIYDFVVCVLFVKDRSLANTLHHVCALLGYLCVFIPKTGSLFAFLCNLTEITTVVLHLVFILRSFPHFVDHVLTKFLGVLLLLLWIPFRLLVSIFSFFMALSKSSEFFDLPVFTFTVLLLTGSTFALLNFYWFYLLFKKVLQALGKSDSKQD
ncbi:hypothetical protein RCL1_008563 [Eukaryota sp. TZLM3-RCL]